MAVKRTSPFTLAFGALVLALTTPAIVALAARIGAIAGTATTIAAPLVALAVLFAFAFHVRFALGALRGRRPAASVIAWLAIVVGVLGFIGSVLVLMEIVAP